MRKLLFILAVNSLWITAYTQPVKKQAKEENSKMQIGISAGKNLTYPVGTFDDWLREKTGLTPKRLGFAAAFHFQFTLNKHWALRAECLYQHKRGYFYSYYNPFKPYHYRIEDDIRLSIPVLLRYNANRFFAEIGPYIGHEYGVASYYCQSPGGKLTHSNTYKTSGIELYKGACAGIGYHIIDKELFSLSVNLRNDQEIRIKKKFLQDHPYNTTMLLVGFNYKL